MKLVRWLSKIVRVQYVTQSQDGIIKMHHLKQKVSFEICVAAMLKKNGQNVRAMSSILQTSYLDVSDSADT
jgi:hypothetical protein